MIGFFILGLILHAVAMAMPAVLRDDRLLNRAVNLLNALALMCGLLFSLNSLLASQLWELRLALPMVGNVFPSHATGSHYFSSLRSNYCRSRAASMLSAISNSMLSAASESAGILCPSRC